MTIANAVRVLAQDLRGAGFDTADLDARLLVAALTGLSSSEVRISTKALSDAEQAQLQGWRARRLAREPVARILGTRGFWTLDLELSPATLEPRPDSEAVIELALQELGPRKNQTLRIIDLGTGTGALLLALLSECPQAFGTGIDLSAQAAATAQWNAKKHQLHTRSHFVCSNWFDALSAQFDLIVSNPPYIGSNACLKLSPEVRLYDPPLALDGGDDGLDAYRAIAGTAAQFLEPNGLLILEIGHDQENSVTALFKCAGFARRAIKRDLGGHVRALCFTIN